MRVEDRLMDSGHRSREKLREKQNTTEANLNQKTMKKSYSKPNLRPRAISPKNIQKSIEQSKQSINNDRAAIDYKTNQNYKSNSKIVPMGMLSPGGNIRGVSNQSAKSLNKDSMNISVTASNKKIPDSVPRYEAMNEPSEDLVDVRKHLSTYYSAKGQNKVAKFPPSQGTVNKNNISMAKKSFEETKVIKKQESKPITSSQKENSIKEDNTEATYQNAPKYQSMNTIQSGTHKQVNSVPFNNTSTTKGKYNFINPGVQIPTNHQVNRVDEVAHIKPLEYTSLKNASNTITNNLPNTTTNKNKRIEDLNNLMAFATNVKDTIKADKKESQVKNHTKKENTTAHKQIETSNKSFNPHANIKIDYPNQNEKFFDYLEKMKYVNNEKQQHQQGNNSDHFNYHHKTNSHSQAHPQPEEINVDKHVHYDHYIDKQDTDRYYIQQRQGKHDYVDIYNQVTSQQNNNNEDRNYRTNVKSEPNNNIYSSYRNTEDDSPNKKKAIGLENNNQDYENEYNKIKSHLDYYNERLKLSDVSKDFVKGKVGEFVTTKNPQYVNSNIGKYFFNF
jgi:hypothetical protein